MDIKLCFLLIGLFAISDVLAEDAPASSEDSKAAPPSVATPAASVEPAKTENKTTAIQHDMDYQSDEAAPTVAPAPVAVNTSSTMPPLDHSPQKMQDEDKTTTESSPKRMGSSPGILNDVSATGTEATKTLTTLPAGGKKSAGHKSGSDFLRGSFVLASLCLIFAKAVQ